MMQPCCVIPTLAAGLPPRVPNSYLMYGWPYMCMDRSQSRSWFSTEMVPPLTACMILARPEVSLQLGDVVLGAAHGVTVAPSHDAESLISSLICMPHGRSRGLMYMHCPDHMKRSVHAVARCAHTDSRPDS